MPVGIRAWAGAEGSIAEYNSSNSLITQHVYGVGVDHIVASIDASGNKTYNLQDGRGNVVASSNQSQSSIQTFTASPFGLGAGGSSQSEAGGSYKWKGRRVDAETGLVYNRARMYNPRVGRFLQTDPIGYGDGLNMYHFGYNDPINFSDPSGLTGLFDDECLLDSTKPGCEVEIINTFGGFIFDDTFWGTTISDPDAIRNFTNSWGQNLVMASLQDNSDDRALEEIADTDASDSSTDGDSGWCSASATSCTEIVVTYNPRTGRSRYSVGFTLYNRGNPHHYNTAAFGEFREFALGRKLINGIHRSARV